MKSLELPGGWKIELNDLREVTDKAKNAGLLPEKSSKSNPDLSFLLVADNEPNLALAGLRIEIEKRLKMICEKHRIHTRYSSVSQMLKALDKNGVLTTEQRSALNDLTGLLNAAVHGATVDQQTAGWAIEIAPDLLESLDRLIEPTGPKIFYSR